MRSAKRNRAAQEIVEMSGLIPLVLRVLASGIKPAGYGIVPGHIRLLALLESGPCNLSELAGRQVVSLPTMSNSVSVLAERGWVKRTRSAHDRRMVCLELTPVGRAVLDEIKRQAAVRVADLLAPLSGEEYETLLAGLAVMRRAFEPIVRVAKQEERCKGALS